MGDRLFYEDIFIGDYFIEFIMGIILWELFYRRLFYGNDFTDRIIRW